MRTTTIKTFSYQAFTEDNSAFNEVKLEWSEKEYRHSYLEGTIENQLAYQIKLIREDRKISQEELARKAGVELNEIILLEDSTESKQDLTLLTKIAEIFDCALNVYFSNFSHLARRIEALNRQELVPETFEQEVTRLEKYSVR